MGIASCKEEKLEVNSENITIVTKEQVEYKVSEEVVKPSETEKEVIIKEVKTVMMQGELIKPMPGKKGKGVTRWVQLNNGELKYYKNEYAACFWWDRPINSLQLACVEGVVESEAEDLYMFELLEKRKDERDGVEGISKKASWKTRNEKIENLGKRFVFATKSRDERSVWVEAIRSIIEQ